VNLLKQSLRIHKQTKEKNMDTPNVINIVVMILVGAACGGLASSIMRGNNSFLTNAILGIAGAVVGGMIFNWLGLTPGAGVVKVIGETFGVQVPQNIVGMIISGTLGAILIIFVVRLLSGKKSRR
jgi:uncharacterized membrane protein YeaQ/YmgE (transglycosylase-associated protein family)